MGWAAEVEGEGWARTGGAERSHWRWNVLYANKEHTHLFGFSLPVSSYRSLDSPATPSEMV